MTVSRVLVVDDDLNGQRMLELLLTNLGCEVLCANHGGQALQLLQEGPVDLVITDLNMPEMSGLELLAALRGEANSVPVIVVTAYGTVETAVAAMKYGAFDYLIRPLDIDQLELVIRKALDQQRIVRENLFLRDEIDKGWDDFIGQSEPMRQVYDLIQQVGPSKASVLIMGETGTGKELAARAVHRCSGRQGLFVPINCAAIPADILESELFGYVRGAFTGAHKDKIGKFELANEGTLFLDEITEMHSGLQAKLLRVLQENTIDRLGSHRSTPVDIRIIAATNREPRASIQEGHLREDLFYRLNVVGLQLPSLRERPEDIPLLAEHFIEKYSSQLGFGLRKLTQAAKQTLLDYSWPGNVRELENVMERAVVLSRSEWVDVGQLPAEITRERLEIPPLFAPSLAITPQIDEEDLDLEQQVERLEKRLIGKALGEVNDNKSKAARLLKISERSLWYKVKKYGL